MQTLWTLSAAIPALSHLAYDDNHNSNIFRSSLIHICRTSQIHSGGEHFCTANIRSFFPFQMFIWVQVCLGWTTKFTDLWIFMSQCQSFRTRSGLSWLCFELLSSVADPEPAWAGFYNSLSILWTIYPSLDPDKPHSPCCWKTSPQLDAATTMLHCWWWGVLSKSISWHLGQWAQCWFHQTTYAFFLWSLDAFGCHDVPFTGEQNSSDHTLMA